MAIASEDLEYVRKLTSPAKRDRKTVCKLRIELPKLNTALEVDKSRSDPPSPPPGPPPSPSD
jgi:hypothetical protein